MKGRISYPVGLILLLHCLLLLFAPAFGAREASAAPKDLPKGYGVESLADGKMTDLGTLSKGKPFYVVFSTPT